MDRLQFKSKEEFPDDKTTSNNIVLCTDNRTYNIRQVSTSNSVFVVQASQPQEDSIIQGGLEAIAQCTSVLEVLPENNASALPHFKAVLPTYTSTGHYERGRSVSKQELFAHTPVSDAECGLAWRLLCCFELDGVALLPSESVKLKVWQAMLTGATAQGIDLAGPIDAHQRDAIVKIDSDWPVELCSALLFSASFPGSSANELTLDDTGLARMVGSALLRERTEDGRSVISATEFQARWADLMPEKWRDRADLSLLGDRLRRENNGADVSYAESGTSQSTDGPAAAPAEAKSSIGAKRKWHEKFRASKKTA